MQFFFNIFLRGWRNIHFLCSYFTYLMDKYCTNFANVYNICQFLCVYNLYIKRANRLMNSYFNWFSELSFFLFFFPNFFFYKCFLQSLPIWFELVFVFCFIILLRIFTCLLCTCNISLYCIHTKSGSCPFYFFFSSSLPVWFELVFCFLFYIFKDLYMFTLYLQYKLIWYTHKK